MVGILFDKTRVCGIILLRRGSEGRGEKILRLGKSSQRELRAFFYFRCIMRVKRSHP